MSQSRKYRGYATERSVATYLSQWWSGATVQRGNGKDVVNVPFDCEIKSRSQFSPMEFLRQAAKRAAVSHDLPFVVCRMNGQSDKQEAVPEYLAFMRFGDLVQLLLRAGYGDIQKNSVQLEPERCTQCGSWKLKEVPCRTCEKAINADL
jgi:hypothetical protein